MAKKTIVKPVDVNERPKWLSVVLIVLVILLVAWAVYALFTWLMPDKVGATNVCDSGKYCADWNNSHTYCYDWDYRLCHINPSQAVQHNFNNENSCDNHLGTPHNQSTYDVAGLCPTVTPTPTPTATPTPTPTPEPTPPVCDQQDYTCGECSEKPNDDWCGEYKYGYCKEYYSCGYSDDVWSCECPVEPTPTTTPAPQEPSKPEGCTQNCGVPACTDTTPQPVTNPHIYRNGSCAIVKYWPSSDKVNIYWKEVSAGDWQHALANQPATGSHEICALSGDVTFGVQSVSGCAADGIVNASNISEIVDGNTSQWVLFR
jgi:hypothetical protein